MLQRKNQYTIIEKCTHYADDEEELTVLGHHLSENLPIAEDAYSPEHTEGDDGEVDHALEEEEEVGIIGRGARKLQLQGITFFFHAGTCSNLFVNWRKKNLLITSSFVILMFDDTYMFFFHCLFSQSQPAEFHVCVISLDDISLMGFQNCIAILFFPLYLNSIREKILKKAKMCSSTMAFYFLN